MTGSVGELVAELLAVRRSLAEAAVTSLRAQADATQALTHLTEVRQGSSDAALGLAVTEAEVARDKAGRYARLLMVAANHIAAYVNTIAPGAASTGPETAASPSGERLVAEAERRRRRADAFWSKQTQKADDTQDSLTNVENKVQEIVSLFKQKYGGQGAATSTTTGHQPAPSPDRPQVDTPVTAAIMAAGALAVATKAIAQQLTRRRTRRRDTDDQT